MKRYVVYLMQTLERHGVKIDNKQPTLVGPVDPTKEQNVRSALQSAARAAFQAGQCAPQLIFIILPGRSASRSDTSWAKLMIRDAFLYEQIKRLSFMDLKGEQLENPPSGKLMISSRTYPMYASCQDQGSKEYRGIYW